jgi:hypothetical protein
VDPNRNHAGPGSNAQQLGTQHLNAQHLGVQAAAAISDQELFDTFVTPQMMRYFLAKMPELGEETLRLRLCELLKYLLLVRFSPGRILFGRDIDNLWHYWILQTRQYAQLCEKLPGGSFRHHSSNDYQETADATDTVSVADALQRALSFFISYYRNFGPIAEDRLACWPVLAQIAEAAEWDLDALNSFLHEQAMLAAV